MRVRASRNGNYRAFGVHGIGEAGNRVGEARRGVHANAGLLGYSTPGIGHVYRGLLMTRIDDAEVLIRHDVEDRQNMIAGQAEDIFHALELERLTNKMTACDSRHGWSPKCPCLSCSDICACL